LAHNKLLSKQLETLTETLSKLPKQFNVNQPSHSAILQVGGCNICGGAHESGHCIPIDDFAQEVNYMGGNKPRQGYNASIYSSYNASRYSGFQLGSNFNQQQGQWRSHPGNQFNKEQRGPSNWPQQQGPSVTSWKFLPGIFVNGAF